MPLLLQRPAPRVFTTDQGGQFISATFTGAVLKEGIKVSTDGKGRATDNAFIERRWRSIKQRCVHLNSTTNGNGLRRPLADHCIYYNHHRPHQDLDGPAPAHLYVGLPDTRNRSLKPPLIQPDFTLTSA